MIKKMKNYLSDGENRKAEIFLSQFSRGFVFKTCPGPGIYQTAKNWYERGMIAARQAGDTHAYNELQAAYEDFID
jgi:hypothetical protein